jgi:hypothetical protein
MAERKKHSRKDAPSYYSEKAETYGVFEWEAPRKDG